MSEFSGSFIKESNSKVINVKGTRLKSIPGGNEGMIAQTNITLEHNGKRRYVPNTMIIKKLEPEYHLKPTAYGKNVLIKYHWLKTHGLPVVPTLRFDPEKNIILMTDMTLQGKQKIIDRHNPLFPTDKPIPNIEALKIEAKEVAEKAYAKGNGVFLAADSYAILVDSQGFGKLCLLDFGQLSYKLSNHNDITNGTDRRFFVADARRAVDAFFARILP